MAEGVKSVYSSDYFIMKRTMIWISNWDVVPLWTAKLNVLTWHAQFEFEHLRKHFIYSFNGAHLAVPLH